MGMTIDEAELWAEQNNFTIVADEWWKYAQDIICKYDKIEQILKDIPYGGEATVRRIQEVVEDEKVN